MRRLFTATTLTLALVAAGCAGDGSGDGSGGSPNSITGPSNVGTPPRQTTGSLAFSTTASQGWSTIDVTVDGLYVGTIRRYMPANGSASSCTAVADTRLVTSVAAGSHSYSARTNTGGTWNGTVSVSSGGCQEIVLNCPNGNCG